MKPVLILQHQTPERPAYLTTWLKKHNINYVTVNAEYQEFPSSINEYSALSVMGGAMSANDKLFSNRQAEILILQSMYKDIPVIGHCLGGQLMSKALGGKITKSYKPEIGWQPIQYVNSDLSYEWFGQNPTQNVIHWHYESFSIPEGATLLASSQACTNQAFSIGKHLAMQFHIEIDRDKVFAWANDVDPYYESIIGSYDSVQDKNQIINGIDINIDNHQKTADNIYTNWLKTTEWSNLIKN